MIAQAPARDGRSLVSVFVVTVKYSGQRAQDVARCPTRRSAAHAAAVLAVSTRPDGKSPVSVGIVVESEAAQPIA